MELFCLVFIKKIIFYFDIGSFIKITINIMFFFVLMMYALMCDAISYCNNFQKHKSKKNLSKIIK